MLPRIGSDICGAALEFEWELLLWWIDTMDQPVKCWHLDLVEKTNVKLKHASKNSICCQLPTQVGLIEFLEESD